MIPDQGRSTGTGGRKRVLLAPIPITPTKPLTPSHVKGMLWVDVMLRTTSQLADVDCLYSNLTANGSEQTVGFWEYLDREHDDVDFDSCGEIEIGELYLRYHTQTTKPPYAALAPYFRAVESGRWHHPSSLRLCDIWAAQVASLGIENPGLMRNAVKTMPLEALVDALKAKDLCLDLRGAGGALYLDATTDGLPLRRAITQDGQANYLINMLRDLVPIIPDYDHIVLIHDEELDADYTLLQRILTKLGTVAERVSISRVGINGLVQSARFGGWKGYTASALISHCLDEADLRSVRLGMRLYFIATLGKGQSRSIDLRHLERSTRRATALLSESPGEATEAVLQPFLRRHGGKECYVDPYRITTGLLSRHSGPSVPIGVSNRWYM